MTWPPARCGVGRVWPDLKQDCENTGLVFDVIETVPVHEDIKLGRDPLEQLLDNYQENIRRFAEAGVKCVCYDFMPVFDWTRTQLDKAGRRLHQPGDVLGADEEDGPAPR